MLRAAVILLLMFSLTCEIHSQDKILSVGEELNYVVYYGFIKLGEVKIKLTGKKTENGTTIYSSNCAMKSYNGIPFVNLNSVFESEMVYDGKDIYSSKFKATEHKENDLIVITEYSFNYDSQYVYVKKTNNGKTERDEKINFNKNVKFQDGLSLFYQARINSLTTDNYLIPVFMNETETSVSYFFSSKSDKVSLSAYDNDINAVRCSGSANFTGVFGLSGEFEGWFSNDLSRVPLKSQLNVLIGNITLELDSYKSKDWKLLQ